MKDALLASTQSQLISSIMLKLNSQTKQLANKDQVIDSLEIELQKLMTKENNALPKNHASFCMQNQWIHKPLPGLNATFNYAM